jgi:hypothetical protein
MLRPFVCSLAVALAPATFGGDLVVFYDAAQGALPTERCWDAIGAQNAPAPTIVEGALLHGTTGYGNTSYFNHPFPPIFFADGAAIEASIKVDSSTWYASNPYKRCGFYLTISDNAGKYAQLGISNDRVLLSTADQNWSDQTYLINTTTAYHTYRLEILGSTATVFIDGAAVLTDTVGSGATANRAAFGDLSVLGNSKTRTQYVKVEGVPVCTVADIDCSGMVDANDLAVLIGALGTSLCEADLNEDGLVNGLDLAILLGLWG